jgi:hypothetical protein
MGLATLVEERDLTVHFGDKYRHYSQTVPRFLPRFRAARRHEMAAQESPPLVESAS